MVSSPLDSRYPEQLAPPEAKRAKDIPRIFLAKSDWTKLDAMKPATTRTIHELNDSADVGHPALFRVDPLLLPNNQENNENADQRRYQKELTHKRPPYAGIKDGPRRIVRAQTG